MITIRPIDEELSRLHSPVETAEDDLESALDGFSVTSSGSVMIPSGLTRSQMMQHSSASTMNNSYNSVGSYPPPEALYTRPRSLPRSPPNQPRSLPRFLPRSLPQNLPHQYPLPNHQMVAVPQFVHPYPSYHQHQQAYAGW